MSTTPGSRSDSRSGSSLSAGGCLRALLRVPLIALLALTTSATLFVTVLANLNSRGSVTGLAAEAGTELLTPTLISQAVIKADYQDMRTQAAAQPSGSVYFPFLRVPISANAIAGKSIADTLRVIYAHVAGAYYDGSGFDGIFGFTSPQLTQYHTQIAKNCPEVLALGDNATPPSDLDVSFIFAAALGQNSTGSSGSKSQGSGNSGKSGNSGGQGTGSGQNNSAQTRQLVSLAKIVCASIKRGNGLSSSDLNNILGVLRSATSSNNGNSSNGSNGSNGPNGGNGSGGQGGGTPSIPQLPDLAHNPVLVILGVSVPFSANAERATTERQLLGLAVSALLALLIVLLSRAWGRMLFVAIGVLLGGATGMAATVAINQMVARYASQLQPYRTLLQLVENTFTTPYLIATIAGALGILVAIGGTIAMKVTAGRAGAVTAPVVPATPSASADQPTGSDDMTVPDLATLSITPPAGAASDTSIAPRPHFGLPPPPDGDAPDT